MKGLILALLIFSLSGCAATCRKQFPVGSCQYRYCVTKKQDKTAADLFAASALGFLGAWTYAMVTGNSPGGIVFFGLGALGIGAGAYGMNLQWEDCRE